MSRKLPDLKAKEVVRALERAGFATWRQKGSHLTMFRQSDRRALTVPMHFSKSVPKGTLYRVIHSSGMSVDEFRRLLK